MRHLTSSRTATVRSDSMADEIPTGTPRTVRLLVPTMGVSGTSYPIGTEVSIRGSGEIVDAFANGDWLPLRWWEYAETSRAC
jgi:hypothetical protein